MRKALFDLLARLGAVHSRAVLAASVVVTGIALVLASGLDLKLGFKDALGPDDPIAIQQTYLEGNFPGASTVLVAIEGGSRDRVIEVGHAVRDRLLARDDVAAVYLEQPVDFFVRHGLLYMPVEDLRLAEATVAEWQDPVSQVLRDPSLLGLTGLLAQVGERQSDRNGAGTMLMSRSFGRTLLGQGPWDGMGLEVGVEVDTQPIVDDARRQWLEAMRDLPLPHSTKEANRLLDQAEPLLDLLADSLDEGTRMSPEAFRVRVDKLRELDLQRLGDGAERYRISPDSRLLLMEVGARDNLAELDLAIPFVEGLRHDVAEIVAVHPDVRIEMTGLPVMLQEEQETLANNFALVTLLGLIGILAVFVIGFERVALPSLAGIPLLMGLIWTFGAQRLVYGEVNLFSMAVPVLIMGVGIDFAIHLLSSYAEMRERGHDPHEALRQSYDHIGAGLLTGAFTTAAAFLVMLGSGFYGLQTMGFTAGFGVLFALVAMLTVLPALVVEFDRRTSRRDQLLPNVPFTFLKPVTAAVHRHRYPVLATFLTLTLAAAYLGADVRFNTNYMDVLPDDLPSIRAQEAILERFGTSNDTVMLVADDLEHAERLRLALEDAGTVARVVSPSVLVPRDQEAKRPYLDALGARLNAMLPAEPPPAHTYDTAELALLSERLASVKAAALDASILAPVLYDRDTIERVGAIRDSLNRIDAHVHPASADRLQHLDRLLATEIAASVGLFQDMTAADTISSDTLPRDVLDRMRGHDGKWIVLANANGNVWSDGFRRSFLRELRTTGVEPMGMVPATDRMMRLLVDEIPGITAMIFGIVALLVLIDLRSLRGTVLALVPLVVGITWTVGAMGLLGVDFNPVNVIAVPLLVGIGIDDGVHLYHRIRHERVLETAVMHSGKAVTLTSLTTGIGFGSLMLSVHPGFFSLGLATTIGIASCLVVSVLLLPALVAIFDEGTLEAE